MGRKSESAVTARPVGMDKQLFCPLTTDEIVALLGDAKVHPIDRVAFEEETRELLQLCEISSALGLVWANYMVAYFSCRAEPAWRPSGRTPSDRLTWATRVTEPESWLRITHGGCVGAWQIIARSGVCVPHLPEIGELLSDE